MSSPLSARWVSSSQASLLMLLLVACGFPRPGDLPGADATVPGDTTEPGLVVHVSPTGDDGNDGLAAPVKTIKHAIGIAAANPEINRIVLASGTYSATSGETFPYTVPSKVTIAGPAGGGAILSGTKTEPAMTVNEGGLQDLDLQDFTTAIIVTGMTSLKNIRVLTSMLAVQAETAARLMVDNLSVAGTAGSCATGIVLNGGAQLTAVTVAMRNLGVTLDARDQSATDIAGANISGDVACSTGLMSVISTGSFVLSDSLLDGGISGIGILAKSPSFQATISNTIVRNMKITALGGFPSSPGSFHMIGGELSNTNGDAIQLGVGTWTFTGVTIRQNKGIALYVQDGRLVMRDCTVTDNGLGINLFMNATADLGTATSNGNNVIQGNGSVGVSLDCFAATTVDAIGNTWNANVQGTNGAGKYVTTATIPGPVATASGNNFSIFDGCNLSR